MFVLPGTMNPAHKQRNQKPLKLLKNLFRKFIKTMVFLLNSTVVGMDVVVVVGVFVPFYKHARTNNNVSKLIGVNIH